MTKVCGSLLLVAALALNVLPAFADISPTQFIGSGIAARSESAVRMEKATVEIIWGTPCALSATFKMVNPSKAPVALKVGFPLPGNDDAPLPTKTPDALTIAFDGEAASVTPPSASREDRDARRDWVWYHCQHTFKPGATTVVVKASLRASLVYATPFREALFYCIQTGGNWDGNIGEEEVTIRFPHPIEKDQITGSAPAGYQVDDNCVRWRLVDFKPVGKEYDISLTYVRPDVMRILSTLRREAARDPNSTAAAVKLAKHLLALGNAKSNSGFLPSWLNKEQYTAILQAIAEAEDKRTFVEHYRMTARDRYEEAGQLKEDYLKHVFSHYSLLRIAQSSANGTLAETADWLNPHVGQPYVERRIVAEAAAGMARRDPPAALRWLEGVNTTLLRGGEASTVGYRVVLDAWKEKEGAPVVDGWMQAQANHPHYDHIAWQYAALVVDQDPNKALKWVNTIKDSKIRREALQGISQRASRPKS